MSSARPRTRLFLRQTSGVKATFKNIVIGLVLMAAAMHCVQSIFYVNVSLLNLQKYEQGQEKMPFQGRVAMMPVLHWGEKRYSAYVATIPTTTKFGQEAYTPEKLISYRAFMFSMAFLVLLCIRYGVQVQREFWWLPPALAILAFYVSYAARITQAYWYPYDLPHAALFTAACLLLLEGKWFLMAAFFLADLPMRETSLYLIPCLLAVGWVRRRRLEAAIFAAIMAAAWLAVHVAITRRFQANPSDVGLHLLHFGLESEHPHYWPQILTAIGYLWLPLAFLWRYLRRDQVAFMLGALPGIVTSGVFGIWSESRVWGEWNAVAACLVFSAIVQYLRQMNQTAVVEVAELQDRSLLEVPVSGGHAAGGYRLRKRGFNTVLPGAPEME